MGTNGAANVASRNLLATAHYLSCMASTSTLAATVLRREPDGGCRCNLGKALVADKSKAGLEGLKELVRSCQRKSIACMEVHSVNDIQRLRRLNREFISHAKQVRQEVRRLYKLDRAGA